MLPYFHTGGRFVIEPDQNENLEVLLPPASQWSPELMHRVVAGAAKVSSGLNEWQAVGHSQVPFPSSSFAWFSQ